MTDKVQKIREEVERLYNQSLADENRQVDRGLECAANVSYGKVKACKELLSFIDSLQEEPKKCMYSKDDYTDEDRTVLCDGCEEECKYSKSDDFTKALAECIHQAQCNVVDPMVLAETWKDELIKLAKSEDLVSKDLEEASKEWLRPQLDKSYANYGEKKMMELTHFDGYAMLDAIEFGAKLQKQQLMAKAFDFTKEHDTACVLASECLRNHGWFNRERDFNDLWRHLSCVDELFVGKFSGKTKVIVIKED